MSYYSVYGPEPKPRRVFRASLRNLGLGTLACLMVAGLGFLTAAKNKDSAAKESPPANASKPEVVVDNFSFSPKEITVPVGTTVTWTNHDDVPHTVASADNQFKKSPALDTDQSFSHTFTVAGSYTYFCTIHPHMTGKVIVK